VTRVLPTVAIIGPDGAGKTTIARRLERSLPLRTRYLYMGWNYDASNVMLPSNRLLQRLREDGDPPGASAGRRRLPVLHQLAAALKLANLLAEGWYRQIVANRWRRKGYLVIFDRHFVADFTDGRLAGGRNRARRIRHAILRGALPRPGIVIYLDAPPETLLERKGEGTLESLERQRRAYRRIVAQHGRALEVRSDRDLSVVMDEVRAAILTLLEEGPRHG
jgi:thymidylate kinase